MKSKEYLKLEKKYNSLLNNRAYLLKRLIIKEEELAEKTLIVDSLICDGYNINSKINKSQNVSLEYPEEVYTFDELLEKSNLDSFKEVKIELKYSYFNRKSFTLIKKLSWFKKRISFEGSNILLIRDNFKEMSEKYNIYAINYLSCKDITTSPYYSVHYKKNKCALDEEKYQIYNRYKNEELEDIEEN